MVWSTASPPHTAPAKIPASRYRLAPGEENKVMGSSPPYCSRGTPV